MPGDTRADSDAAIVDGVLSLMSFFVSGAMRGQFNEKPGSNLPETQGQPYCDQATMVRGSASTLVTIVS